MKLKHLQSITLLLLSSEAFAHHSYQATFDNRQTISLSGSVVKVEWRNPHIEYTLAVTTVDGELETWTIPTAAPRVASSNNLNVDSINKGDHVMFRGWPARDGSNSMRATSVILEDGRSFRLNPMRGSKGEANRGG